jgi:hypothetical protein
MNYLGKRNPMDKKEKSTQDIKCKSSQDDSDYEDDLQMMYNKLYKEFVKLKKKYQISFKKLSDVEHEKESLVAKLSESHILIDSLKSENLNLNEKIKSLENDLDMSNNQLKKFSSEHLDCLIDSQKSRSDKNELSFDYFSSTSQASSVTTCKSTLIPASSDNGKKICDDPCVTTPKSKYVPPFRRQASQKFVPTCHHCGKVGHIRPNCFKLKPREHLSDDLFFRNNHEGLFNMMRVVLTKMDELENHGFQSHMSRHSFKKAWVPKGNTIRRLRGSGSDPTYV